MPLSPSEQLLYSTVLIKTVTAEKKYGSGTGFLFMFKIDDTNEIVVLVTNHHVIKDKEIVEIEFVSSDKDDPEKPDPLNVHRYQFIKNPDEWILHPDGQTDLAMVPIGKILNDIKNRTGVPAFIRPASPELIPDDDTLKDFDAVEEIAMIGYPIGLRDEVNRLPIFRTGNTATPIYADYDGKPEFMIDCACIPGSSGSPVFLYSRGTYFDKSKQKNILGGLRMSLFGILYGGPMMRADGSIRIEPAPLDRMVAETDIPINLGLCIRASKVMEFKDVLFEKLKDDIAKNAK